MKLYRRSRGLSASVLRFNLVEAFNAVLAYREKLDTPVIIPDDSSFTVGLRVKLPM
jgi:hypothetical protein